MVLLTCRYFDIFLIFKIVIKCNAKKILHVFVQYCSVDADNSPPPPLFFGGGGGRVASFTCLLSVITIKINI